MRRSTCLSLGAGLLSSGALLFPAASYCENLEGNIGYPGRGAPVALSVKPLVAEELPLLAIRAAASGRSGAASERSAASPERSAGFPERSAGFPERSAGFPERSAVADRAVADPTVSDSAAAGARSGVGQSESAGAGPEEPRSAAARARGALEYPLPGNAHDSEGGSKGSAFAARVRSAAANLFRLSRVSVTGNYRIADEEVLRRAELQGQPWIWERSLEDVGRRIRENPWVEDVRIRRSFFPLAIEVEVIEAEPWLIAEYDQRSWIVSRSGNLIQTLAALTDSDLILETTELPRLDGLAPESSVTNVLSSGNARFLFAVRSIKLLHAAGELPFAVSRYSLLPSGGIEMFPADDVTLPRVIVSSQTLQEAEEAIRRLKIVLADLRQRGERPRRIDLRFANQVVVQ